MTSLSTLAQQVPLTPDSPAGWITSGGIVGLLSFAVVAFMRGWVISGPEHHRQLEEKDREITELRTDRTEMTLFLREQVMPALTRSNDFASTLAEQKAMEDRDRILHSREKQ